MEEPHISKLCPEAGPCMVPPRANLPSPHWRRCGHLGRQGCWREGSQQGGGGRGPTFCVSSEGGWDSGWTESSGVQSRRGAGRAESGILGSQAGHGLQVGATWVSCPLD